MGHDGRSAPVRSRGRGARAGSGQASFESFFEDTRARLFGALMVVTASRHEAEEADT